MACGQSLGQMDCLQGVEVKVGRSQAGFESIATDVTGLVVLGTSQLEHGD